MDKSCHFCGSQVTSKFPWQYQGVTVWVCYECWDALIGDGSEEPEDQEDE